MNRASRHTYVRAGLVAGLVLLAIGIFLSPTGAAAAWLFAMLSAFGLTTGAICLLLAGQLTGGAWIAALGPPLARTARLVPLVGLGFIPLFLAAPLLYPWAAHGAHDAMTGSYYLNGPLVLARLVIAFAGWTLIAWTVPGMRGGRGQVWAGIGLVFHVTMTTFLAYDWLAALQEGFTSSVFGSQVAILALVSALCAATILTPIEDAKARRDVAGLVIAGILGCVYIGFMQFLIIWYGDLSETAQYFLDRAGVPGIATIVVILTMDALLPLALLLPERGRNSPVRLRAAALLVLVGVVLHWAWSVLGLFGFGAVLLSVPALIIVACALALLDRSPHVRRLTRSRERTA